MLIILSNMYAQNQETPMDTLDGSEPQSTAKEEEREEVEEEEDENICNDKLRVYPDHKQTETLLQYFEGKRLIQEAARKLWSNIPSELPFLH